MCLVNRQATRVHPADEKIILLQAGLGIKKISFAADDDEKAVVEKINLSEKTGDLGEFWE